MTGTSRYGIYKARLPLPFKLDHVNCYAVKGDNGWTVIDTGLYYEETRRAWKEFMAEHGFQPGDIEAIYVTHYHPDHYGSAGWLQELSGAPVYMSATEAALAKKIWSREPEDRDIMLNSFLENGVPRELAEKLLDGIDHTSAGVYQHPTVTTLSAGNEVELGGYKYRVIITPGHSDGHVCFYGEENGILISGDHLLPKITSNISLWPHSHPDPLDNFFKSLEQNKTLEVSLVLPAHGNSFSHMRERVDELIEHHKQRLEIMKDAAGEKGATVFEVSSKVFSGDLTLHEIRFALTETLAHLVYLEKRGHLRVSRRDGCNVYCKVS